MEEFDKFFKLYYKDIYRLAYSYVLNRCDAEDLTQKSFYKLYINIKKINLSDIEIKKWLSKVVVNESKNLLKSSWFKNSQKTKDKNLEVETNSFEYIDNKLAKIAKNYRIPLYLFYYEGYSIKEIAEIINKKESAVKMILSRGRDALKKEMED